MNKHTGAESREARLVTFYPKIKRKKEGILFCFVLFKNRIDEYNIFLYIYN